MYDESLTAKQRRMITREAINYMSINDLPELYAQKRIPNVRTFKVKLIPEEHPVFGRYGIKKRKFHPILDSEPYINKPLNRYIHHQFCRLNKHRTDSRTFFRISEHLLNRSSSYASLLLYETFPGWHRNKSYPEMWEAIRELRNMDLRKYKHRQVGIPKGGPGSELRYLNIPSNGWRLYLHGLNRILQIWLTPYYHPSQHGFIPHRGTGTAWLQIHENVLKSPNIYEFDLKKYFDSINLDYLRQTLKATGIPTPLLNNIIRWSRTATENTTESTHSWDTPEEEAQDYKYYITGASSPNTDEEHHYWLIRKRKAEKTHPHLKRYDYYRGVAQGSPTSPLISTLIITRLLLNNPHCKVVQYADDGILYDLTLSPEEILTFPPESGIRVNWLKSRWLRRDGKWLNPLKFLGLVYEYTTDTTIPESQIRQHGTLSNATRSPKPVTVDIYHVIEDAWAYDHGKQVSPTTGKSDSFEEWFKTKYHGLLMSMIYKGRLDIDNLQQDFTYHYKNRSWSDLNESGIDFTSTIPANEQGHRIKVDVFNSSSFAHQSLANRITKTLRWKPLSNFRY